MADKPWYKKTISEISGGKKKYVGEYVGISREALDALGQAGEAVMKKVGIPNKTFSELSGGKAKTAGGYGALKVSQNVEAFKKRVKKAFGQ